MDKKLILRIRRRDKSLVIPLLLLFFWIAIVSLLIENANGTRLFPRDSRTREVLRLDGIWHFKLSQLSEEVMFMPVPSSFNDVTMGKKIRNHIGEVVYEKRFFVPASWLPMFYRVWLRFGSVNYSAAVWINGEEVLKHEIGNLPFGTEITDRIYFGRLNQIEVRVSNELSDNTIPQRPMDSEFDQDFNYAGIDGPVYLYTTPEIYIDDVSIEYDILEENTVSIRYTVTLGGNEKLRHNLITCAVELRDKEDVLVPVEEHIQDDEGRSGTIVLKNAKLWWPNLMHENPGYMYKLRMRLLQGPCHYDIYDQPFGIRSLKLVEDQWMINNKPIYIRGVDERDDSDVSGRGTNLTMITRDYYLAKWIGANTYWTSHRPLSDEAMDLADRTGIMVINECSASNIRRPYSQELREKHIESMRSLIRRDKHRPSVIMWSLGFNPSTNSAEANEYFQIVANEVKSYDKSRPITAVMSGSPTNDELGKYLDIIGIVGVSSQTTGIMPDLKDIKTSIQQNANNWFNEYKKPIFIAQYGVDSGSGIYSGQAHSQLEEYQAHYMLEHFRAFDKLRKRMGKLFLGELSPFNDYTITQGHRQSAVNGKGVFTRQRKLKASAHILRKRYWNLAQQIDNVLLPTNLKDYVVRPRARTRSRVIPHVTTSNPVPQLTRIKIYTSGDSYHFDDDETEPETGAESSD